MTDRELLERAAKAAGVQLAWNMNVLPNGRPYPVNATTGAGWSPLTDDGDALRLLVTLRETLALDAAAMLGLGQFQAWNLDPLAATRRAIVRAAAALAEGAK
jgi:hypothetical protein